MKIFSHLPILCIHKIRMDFTALERKLRYHLGGYYISGSMRKHPHWKGICHYCNNSVEEEKEIWACSELILLRLTEYRKWEKETQGQLQWWHCIIIRSDFYWAGGGEDTLSIRCVEKCVATVKYLMAWGRLSTAWLVLRLNCKR